MKTTKVEKCSNADGCSQELIDDTIKSNEVNDGFEPYADCDCKVEDLGFLLQYLFVTNRHLMRRSIHGIRCTKYGAKPRGRPRKVDASDGTLPLVGQKRSAVAVPKQARKKVKKCKVDSRPLLTTGPLFNPYSQCACDMDNPSESDNVRSRIKGALPTLNRILQVTHDNGTKTDQFSTCIAYGPVAKTIQTEYANFTTEVEMAHPESWDRSPRPDIEDGSTLYGKSVLHQAGNSHVKATASSQIAKEGSRGRKHSPQRHGEHSRLAPIFDPYSHCSCGIINIPPGQKPGSEGSQSGSYRTLQVIHDDGSTVFHHTDCEIYGESAFSTHEETLRPTASWTVDGIGSSGSRPVKPALPVKKARKQKLEPPSRSKSQPERWTAYDPRTIATAILKAEGIHPSMPPLNSQAPAD